MKVAVLTHHFVYNYGANLQSLATTRTLQALGCDVEIINWRAPDLEARYQRTVPREQARLHEDFVSRHLPLSPLFRTGQQIGQYYRVPENRPDLVIVGSDTVLNVRPRGSGGTSEHAFDNPFWLRWLDDDPELRNIPTAFLSVSSDGARYPLLEPEARHAIVVSLRNRRMVTVRDRWTRWMICSIAPRSMWSRIQYGTDPVFMLSRWVDFEAIDLSRFDLPERYVLFNVYNERCTHEWVSAFSSHAKQNGYEVLALPNPEGTPHWPELRTLFPMDPLEWFSVIRRSSGYVGNRFHPIVVSLANQVPFVAVDGYGVSPVWNYPSKTYDICATMRRTRQWMKARIFRWYHPKRIFEMLLQQDADTTELVSRAQDIFTQNIDRMLALGSAVHSRGKTPVADSHR